MWRSLQLWFTSPSALLPPSFLLSQPLSAPHSSGSQHPCLDISPPFSLEPSVLQLCPRHVTSGSPRAIPACPLSCSRYPPTPCLFAISHTSPPPPPPPNSLRLLHRSSAVPRAKETFFLLFWSEKMWLSIALVTPSWSGALPVTWLPSCCKQKGAMAGHQPGGTGLFLRIKQSTVLQAGVLLSPSQRWQTRKSTVCISWPVLPPFGSPYASIQPTPCPWHRAEGREETYHKCFSSGTFLTQGSTWVDDNRVKSPFKAAGETSHAKGKSSMTTKLLGKWILVLQLKESAKIPPNESMQEYRGAQPVTCCEWSLWVQADSLEQ